MTPDEFAKGFPEDATKNLSGGRRGKGEGGGGWETDGVGLIDKLMNIHASAIPAFPPQRGTHGD